MIIIDYTDHGSTRMFIFSEKKGDFKDHGLGLWKFEKALQFVFHYLINIPNFWFLTSRKNKS